jgi:hypothetical protein
MRKVLERRPIRFEVNFLRQINPARIDKVPDRLILANWQNLEPGNHSATLDRVTTEKDRSRDNVRRQGAGIVQEASIKVRCGQIGAR